MHTSFPPPSNGLPAPVIKRFCIQCSYPLHDLPPSGNCPECGTSIERSLRAQSLAAAGPAYLMTLRRGTTIVLVALGIFACTSLVGVLHTFISLTAALGLPPMATTLVLSTVSFGVAVLNLAGYWQLTPPAPAQLLASRPPPHSRIILRVAIITRSASSLLMFLWMLTATGTLALLPIATGVSLINIMSFTNFAVTLIFWWSTFSYVRWLATNIPDERLVAFCSRSFWLVPLVFYGSGFFSFILRLFGATLSAPGGLTVFSIINALGNLLTTALVALLFVRLRRHLTSILATGAPADLPGRLRFQN